MLARVVVECLLPCGDEVGDSGRELPDARHGWLSLELRQLGLDDRPLALVFIPRMNVPLNSRPSAAVVKKVVVPTVKLFIARPSFSSV